MENGNPKRPACYSLFTVPCSLFTAPHQLNLQPRDLAPLHQHIFKQLCNKAISTCPDVINAALYFATIKQPSRSL